MENGIKLGDFIINHMVELGRAGLNVNRTV